MKKLLSGFEQVTGTKISQELKTNIYFVSPMFRMIDPEVIIPIRATDTDAELHYGAPLYASQHVI